MAREKNIDFLLAVGGGSVIDGTKLIAAALKFDGEPWDILEKQAEVRDAMPFGSVLTLPATGSEMNSGSVISHRARGDKLPFNREATYPRFSVLDPTTTYWFCRSKARWTRKLYCYVLLMKRASRTAARRAVGLCQSPSSALS